MPGTRDEFSQKTKNALALRAGYRCSYCRQSTVGPSDERPDAVTMVGIAAHICAAASGDGARRYDATMTPEERSHIDNGIWLCATCSVLVDRDEQRFTVDALQTMKREHEHSQRIGADRGTAEGDIISIGPNIIAVGHVVSAGPEGMRVRLIHYVEGSSRELLSFTHDFERLPRENRYILLNELGYGGLLADVPTVERIDGAHEVRFRLQPYIPRRDVTAQIAGICGRTGKMITGMDVFVQNFERALGTARGTWFARIKDGSDLSDLYWRYKGSDWFKRLAMMEMIRLSSVPSASRIDEKPSTTFACVNKVNSVEISSFDLNDHRIIIEVGFDIEGLGSWTKELSVFISTPEQLAEGRANARIHHDKIREIEAEYGKKSPQR